MLKAAPLGHNLQVHVVSRLQAARIEALRLLDASGRPAGMGGAADACHNAAFRGDRTCWLQPDQAEHPALRAACDAVIGLQKGAAWHVSSHALRTLVQTPYCDHVVKAFHCISDMLPAA